MRGPVRKKATRNPDSCLRMIFATNVSRVCREGKPLRTFPDQALIDEFGDEPAADPPGQPALAGMARREDDGKFRWNFGVLGDDLYAALRHVRDRAVARQRAGAKLNLGDPSALLTFASTSIHQHFGPSSPLDNSSSAIPLIYKRTVGITLAEQFAIDRLRLFFIYQIVSTAPDPTQITRARRRNKDKIDQDGRRAAVPIHRVEEAAIGRGKRDRQTSKLANSIENDRRGIR